MAQFEMIKINQFCIPTIQNILACQNDVRITTYVCIPLCRNRLTSLSKHAALLCSNKFKLPEEEEVLLK